MSNCDCEMPEFYSQSSPKARKEHKCCECRGIIKVGEKYERFAGSWSGDFSEYKTCMDCAALRAAVSNLPDACSCITFSGLFEEVFAIESLPHMKEYIAIKEKRGAKMHEWMVEAVKELEACAVAVQPCESGD